MANGQNSQSELPHIQGLRVSAQPFVPNVHAVAFQPGGMYQQGQGYGHIHYPMGGHPGMYGSGVPMGYPPHHHSGYMGGASPLGYPPHSISRGQPHISRQQQHQSHNLSNEVTPTPNIKQNTAPQSTTNDIQAESSTTADSVVADEVESWEQRVEETTIGSIEPIGTKGAVTNENTKIAVVPEPERHVMPEEKTVVQSEGSSPHIGDKTPKVKDEPTPAKVVSSSIKTMVVPPKRDSEKENVNIVFIGHVDAGKSTIGGHIMYLTGGVDKRTLEKYEREAKEKNRETWYLSWALDTNQEERDKGKTVEVGRAFFETDKKRFTILDAPGHAGFVPNMIGGAVQADIGVLVISARRGEFETGFEKGGQTREHAMLAKTAGVKHLVVLINKMDDPTVDWSVARYEECKTKLTPFLKKVGFNPKTDIFFIPVSGLSGANLKEISKHSEAWYKGSAFITYLDDLPPISREDEGPFRMPIAEKFKDMGTIVMGKVESGAVCKGSQFIIMPNRNVVEVLSVIRVEEEVQAAYSGDNIKLKLKGLDDEEISPGFVLCSPHNPCHVGRVFDAQVVILEYKSIICAGFSCVLHIHNAAEEVEIVQLISKIDKKTGKKVPEKPKFIKQDHTAIARFQTLRIICMETFKDFPAMARFTLRDEGKTIAIGKVLKIIE